MDESQNALLRALDAPGKSESASRTERVAVKSALATMGTPEYFTRFEAVSPSALAKHKIMMGDDPALPKMPKARESINFA